MAEALKAKVVFNGQDNVNPILKKILAETKVSFGGIASAARSTFGTLTKIGIGGAVAGLGAMVYAGKRAFDSLDEQAGKLDELGDSAENLGVSGKWLSEMGYAAQRSGSSFEELSAATKKFSINLGDSAKKGGTLYKALLTVPRAQRQMVLGARTTEEAFQATLAVLGGIEGSAKKSAFAVAAFGKSGTTMIALANKGIDGIRKLRAISEHYNPITDDMLKNVGEYGDATDTLALAWDGLKNTFASSFAKTATPFVAELTEFIASNRLELGIEFGKAVEGMAKAVKAVNWTSVGEGIMGAAKGVLGIMQDVDKYVYAATGYHMGEKKDIRSMADIPADAVESTLSPLLVRHHKWQQNPGGFTGLSPRELQAVNADIEKHGTYEEQYSRSLQKMRGKALDRQTTSFLTDMVGKAESKVKLLIEAQEGYSVKVLEKSKDTTVKTQNNSNTGPRGTAKRVAYGQEW